VNPEETDHQSDIFRLLGRLEGKVDNFFSTVERQEKRVSAVEESHEAHAERIRKLETSRAKEAGAIGAGSGIIGALSSLIMSNWSHLFR